MAETTPSISQKDYLDFVREVIKDANPIFKLTVGGAAALSLLCAVFATALIVKIPESKISDWADFVGFIFIPFIIFMLGAGLLFYCVIQVNKRGKQYFFGDKLDEVQLLDMDAAGAKLENLTPLLSTIRTEAFKFLKMELQALNDGDVRANIFLPKTSRQEGDGCAYRLVMPIKLRSNMNYPSEWDIRFLPGQGATGVAFLTGQLRTAHRKFMISDEFTKLIHPDLKSIVSIPIKTPAQKTIAVLNVDVLKHEISDEHLKALQSHLLEQVSGLAKGFEGLPLLTVDLVVRKAA